MFNLAAEFQTLHQTNLTTSVKKFIFSAKNLISGNPDTNKLWYLGFFVIKSVFRNPALLRPVKGPL